MELAIRTEHLTKIYGQRLIAVNDMNLEVPQGSVFGLLGPNGAFAVGPAASYGWLG